MTTIATSPALQVPGRQLVTTFTLTEETDDFTPKPANFVRVWCTVAPTGSSLEKKLNGATDQFNRVQVHEGAGNSTWSYTFDKGGKYTFVAQEYLKGSGYGGGYEGDPSSTSLEEKLGAETTLTIYIGQRTTQPIGPPANRATLVLWVWNDTIEATTKAFHGEDSPAIVAASPTPIVKTAIESTSVVAALAALVGESISDTGTVGVVDSWAHALWQGFSYHFDAAGVHDTDDTDNPLRDSFTRSPDQKSFIDFVNQALKSLRQHVTNDSGTADVSGFSGADSAGYHFDTVKLSDRANISLYDSVSSFAEAYGALADLYRCFDSHQTNLDVHALIDRFLISDLPLLMVLHQQFLTVLASASPDAPPAQSVGVQLLISSAGFKEG